MSQGVKMMHIVCHGNDTDDDKNKDNKDESKLNLEYHDDIGVEDNQFSASKVHEIFYENFQYDKLKLVLIAACHSEKIAQQIKKKVGNAIVIAIKKTNAVLDSAGTTFAKEFYDKILAGETPRLAFEKAKQSIRVNYRTLACCCQHKFFHTRDCKWDKQRRLYIKEYQRDGFVNAEELGNCDACHLHDPLAICKHKPEHKINKNKIPACNCDLERKEMNIHSETCEFYNNFYENFQNVNGKKPTPWHVCCCRDESFPHYEDEKFKIIFGQSLDIEEQKKENKLLDTPLYQEFHPGELVDDNEKKLSLPNLYNDDILILSLRNVEIYNVAKFITKKFDPKEIQNDKVLLVTGTEDTGNYQIVAFAAIYCKERKKIEEAIYFDLSKLNLQNIVDRLNIILSLKVLNSNNEKKYQSNIIHKMNEKFQNNTTPIILIFDNFDKNIKDFQIKEKLLIRLKDEIDRIRIIIIDNTNQSQLNHPIATNFQTITDLRLDKEVDFQKLFYIIAFNKQVNFEIFFTKLDQNQQKKLKKTKQMIRYVSFIQLNQEKVEYIENPNKLIDDAIRSLDQTAIDKNQDCYDLQSTPSQQSLQSSYSQQTHCVTCSQQLDQFGDQLQQKQFSNEQKVRESLDKTMMHEYFKNIDLKSYITSQNSLINDFRKENPFIFQEKHQQRFVDMNINDFELDISKFDTIEGSYQGDILKNTRIQHGRGIFIDKKNFSFYEGWRFKNKREIYGRLIDQNGLIYEGEFKNNVPHGKGKVWQMDSIQGIYPKGFEFIGNFQDGMREQWGLMKIPSDEVNFLQYIGYFKNNQMDGIFTVKNQAGDQLLESYEQDYILRKFKAYVFKHKSKDLFGFIPHIHGKEVSLMPRVTFNSVRKLKNLDSLKFKIVDIDQKILSLQEYQLNTLWMKYKAENKQNILIDELVQGFHPQLESIFEDLLDRIREKYQIKKGQIQQIQQSEFVFSIALFKKQKNNTISILHEDDSLVVKTISHIWQKLNELLQQPQQTLVEDEIQINDINQILKQNDIQEKYALNNDVQSIKLYRIPSVQSEASIQYKKNKLPDQNLANIMYQQMKEVEEYTLDILEFINLTRLVEEQDILTGQIFEVKTKEDIIHSLLVNDPLQELHKYRIILGRVFLEMCVSMHFATNPEKDCIENFMKEKNVLELFKRSKYRKIAQDQLKFNLNNLMNMIIQKEKQNPINLKNAKQPEKDDTILSEEYKSENIVQSSQNIDSQNLDQQLVTDNLGVDVFFNFLGAIAHLIEPHQAVKFVVDILKIHEIFENSQGLSKKTMEKIYNFRNIKELETHVGYQFNDKSILVQSLTHGTKSELNNQQSSLEKSGNLVVKFILLRENMLKNDLKNLESVFNLDIDLFKTEKLQNVSVLSTILGLHSKVIQADTKDLSNSYYEYFEEISQKFQMNNSNNTTNSDDYVSMLDSSLEILEIFIKREQQLPPLMVKIFFSFIGALNIDSKLNNKTYKSFVTLLPYIFFEKTNKASEFLKQQCLEILKEKADIIRFPEMFRVSKEWFQATTQSMKCNFNDQGKLFDIKEFDIYCEKNEEPFNKLSAYIKELEEKNKNKLVNIIFQDEDKNYSAQTTYHIVHSHILSICMRKEEEMREKGLLKKFLTKMRKSAKQRIINEKQILMMTKEDGNGLTLAQKIKILINLNSVQYQKSQEDIERVYQPPTVQEAMNYINKLKVEKQTTYDSIIYTYMFQSNDHGVEKDDNPLKLAKQIDLHFIKQPLLQRHDGVGDTSEIINKNKQYILNNILENQIIQLSHFLSNQESDKQNELIILDEYQLRVVDYFALREGSQDIQKLRCPIQVLSVCFQILSIATQNLHEFGVYNGNIKEDRIKLNSFGYDGFFYNGNALILQPDYVIQKKITDAVVSEDTKEQTVDQIELYKIFKCTPGISSEYLIDQQQNLNKKLSKCLLYRDEGYQIVSILQRIIKKVKKDDSNLTPDQILAKKVLKSIQNVVEEQIKKFKFWDLDKITIYYFQDKLSQDFSIPYESIRLFRNNLKPSFSRNLWIYFDQISPIHPILLKLVFPWKYFKNKYIDLNDFSEKAMNSDEISSTQTQSLSHDQEKMNMLRDLHLNFIEDWWFEIATQMNKSQDLYNKIDSQELEYVKSMVTSQGQRVKFDWLRAKVKIIKYFKAQARREQLETLGEAPNIQKSQEESKKEEEEEPEIILGDVYSMIEEIAEVKEKPRKASLKLVQTHLSPSLTSEDSESHQQDQLRHFVNAAIYSLKDVHFKIYQEYGPQCLKEYIKIIIEALEWIESDSFYEKMLTAFLAVKEQSQFIDEDVLKENQLQTE